MNIRLYGDKPPKIKKLRQKLNNYFIFCPLKGSSTTFIMSLMSSNANTCEDVMVKLIDEQFLEYENKDKVETLDVSSCSSFFLTLPHTIRR